jgi:hypothetical protein
MFVLRRQNARRHGGSGYVMPFCITFCVDVIMSRK